MHYTVIVHLEHISTNLVIKFSFQILLSMLKNIFPYFQFVHIDFVGIRSNHDFDIILKNDF